MRNDGDAAATFDGLAAHILGKSLIAEESDLAKRPTGFECKVWLVDGEASIKRGEETIVRCAMEWRLPPDPPPMQVVVEATFAVRQKGVFLAETEPVAFLLSSRQDFEPEEWPDPDLAALLGQIQCTKSDGLQRLEAAAKP